MPRHETDKVRQDVREFFAWVETQKKPFLMAWCKLVFREKGYNTPGALHSTMRSAGITKDAYKRYNCDEATREDREVMKAPGDRRERLLSKYGVKK